MITDLCETLANCAASIERYESSCGTREEKSRIAIEDKFPMLPTFMVSWYLRTTLSATILRTHQIDFP